MAEAQKCPICGNEFRNLKIHVTMAHKGVVGGNEVKPAAGSSVQENSLSGPGVVPSVEKKPEEKVEVTNTDVMTMLGQILKNQMSQDQRLTKMEQGGRPDIKLGAKASDVAEAASSRDGADARITSIVDEMLGEDFKFEVEPNKDRPGFLFTIVVPTRLSDLKPSSRPVKGENGLYQKVPGTDSPLLEDYQPEDRRSRQISSVQSYDAIREHCERIRGYIVAYYTKMQKPIPEFKLKSGI